MENRLSLELHVRVQFILNDVVNKQYGIESNLKLHLSKIYDIGMSTCIQLTRFLYEFCVLELPHTRNEDRPELCLAKTG